ncbi:related to transcription factors [Cephalotrichum gorgonifer]|uniref:Related to transcription factors n=1 Tax=Cephalotrichum gorgonifer TaxID=2041049 RepID=A0AAE8MYV5_9PEZI|nr:related to transcription factors [Cephalotrichum gorgonifer]
MAADDARQQRDRVDEPHRRSVDSMERSESLGGKGRQGKGGSGLSDRVSKKRRKERPCTRCIKRNISHLCRDEPRDADSRKSKSVADSSAVDELEHQDQGMPSNPSQEQQQQQQQQAAGAMPPPSLDQQAEQARSRQASVAFSNDGLGQGASLRHPVRQSPHARLGGNPLSGRNLSQVSGFSDAWLSTQDQFNGLNSYHANYMIAPEVTDEFNLLENFLHASLLDDGASLADALTASPAAPTRPVPTPDMLPGFHNNAVGAGSGSQNQGGASMPPPPPLADHAASASASASASRQVVSAPAGDSDKARRDYYLQAADPMGNDAADQSGNDTPDERMQRVLKAKYNAGLLKPFNYIKGYHRLSTYLDRTISTSSKQKILRTLNQFRPKFREKAQALTDMELVIVEMWFEKQLMEYDRVFASMAVPSCLWRRTGEIFRGNKEMAELIGVPVERLRDGRLALHEILTEGSLVRYWEEFQTIAFDPDHDSLLTACSIKSPDDTSDESVVHCAFSFMIKRDEHKLPTIIVGNFLPHDPHV